MHMEMILKKLSNKEMMHSKPYFKSLDVLVHYDVEQRRAQKEKVGLLTIFSPDEATNKIGLTQKSPLLLQKSIVYSNDPQVGKKERIYSINWPQGPYRNPPVILLFGFSTCWQSLTGVPHMHFLAVSSGVLFMRT